MAEQPTIILLDGNMPYQQTMVLCAYRMRAADRIKFNTVASDEAYLDAAYERLKKAWNYEKYPHPGNYPKQEADNGTA